MAGLRKLFTVVMLALPVGLGLGCGDDLGECDDKAANELVYSNTWHVATKGQALMNDSCGNGSFCHSVGATGDARGGVAKDLNFDMLPQPSGWPKVMDHRDGIWKSIANGTMPPGKGGAAKLSDGEWSFDPWRRAGSPMLPKMHTKAGQAAFRNWLACGAPVVTQTEVPLWARPTGQTNLGDWSGIYTTIVQGRCANGGCHDRITHEGDLDLSDECKGYKALAGTSGQCGVPRLVPGDVNSSVMQQLERRSTCGDPMPPEPAAPLTDPELDVVRKWIQNGAPAMNCGG
ncbi:MAG: hypothetical protein QM778_10685 [Myxococcales bacterium]